MHTNLIAKTSTDIHASSEKAWDALINPLAIREYMFGTDVVSEWHAGSSIFWRGIWQGKAYEDKGIILQFEPGQLLQYTHYSPLSGLPDKLENYHNVTIELTPNGDQTHVTLTQDNNDSEEERSHSEENWGMMLTALKKFLEQ